MSSLAVVLVHYRTPQLVAPAVAAVAADCEAAGIRPEILLVDNGSDAGDAALWRSLPVRRIDPGANLGYAGGVAAGVARSGAPLVVAMNPDVEVEVGCLSGLVGELERGADAAGPRFFWDAGRRLLLPPTEERSFTAELVTALSDRRGPWQGLARRRWRRHARRHWLAGKPIDSTSLSGALLAFRREAWERIGPFDEGYRLYFEETDWLLRLRRAGGRSRFVPAARAAHWYAQSSIGEPRAAAWFADAERRFRRRWYGRGAAILELARGGRERGEPEAEAAGFETPSNEPPEIPAVRLGIAGPRSWVEASPVGRGFPAAAESLAEGAAGWRLPADVWRRAGTPPLVVRGVDRSGRESRAIRYPPRSAS